MRPPPRWSPSSAAAAPKSPAAAPSFARGPAPRHASRCQPARGPPPTTDPGPAPVQCRGRNFLWSAVGRGQISTRRRDEREERTGEGREEARKPPKRQVTPSYAQLSQGLTAAICPFVASSLRGYPFRLGETRRFGALAVAQTKHTSAVPFAPLRRGVRLSTALTPLVREAERRCPRVRWRRGGAGRATSRRPRAPSGCRRRW